MKARGEVRNSQDLGMLLQQGRMQAGLTQRQLADMLGTDQAYIWDLENGKATKALERIFQIMKITNVDMSLDIPIE